MTPIRVEFALRTPMVVSPTGKTFDALLAWAAVRRADFQGVEDPWAMQHDTGLARHAVDGNWCPMASALDIEWFSQPEQIHYVKRQKQEQYANAWLSGIIKKRPSVDPTRGDTKAGSYVQQTRWVKSIRAFAMVENMALFTGLLPWVTHIGKLHHRDYGGVKSFIVTPDQEAVVRWANRPLPMGSQHATENHAPLMGALQSPYWKRENHTVILSPCQ